MLCLNRILLISSTSAGGTVSWSESVSLTQSKDSTETILAEIIAILVEVLSCIKHVLKRYGDVIVLSSYSFEI